jgi:magnesium-transporting ATPase (P-type)
MGDKKTPDRVSSKDGGDSLEVVFRFIFDHHRMTMSCIVKDKQGTYRIFCKGSAESVKAVCDPKSLPADFDRVQLGYSREGCYTLAFGSRLLTDEELAIVQRDGELDRNAIESNLSFIGLLTFKNELKPDTTVALRRLRQGAIRTLMVSGDHILTAISIAQQCEMIAKGQKVYWARSVKDGGDIDWMDANDNDKPVLLPASDEALANIELAVTGSVFEVLSKSNLLPTWIYRIRVYARMTPGQKIAVVEAYKQLGLIVAFCGDGGNDCGALRAAHVGLALSDAEASVVSPFTGLDLSVMGMVDVMLEGRAGLASAFASYKYMLMYGLVETANQMVNAYFSVTFSSWCWIFMDGFWVIVMAFTIPLARPTQDLSDRRPPSSLLGYQVVSSMLGVLLLNILFMVVGVQVMRAADFYQCRTWEMAGSIGIADQDVIGDNYESSVLFMVTGAQYFTSALAFSYGGEHREPVYKNAWFMFFFLLFAVIHLVTLLTESKLSCLFRVNCEEENIVLESFLSLDTAPINNPWNSTVMPVDFRIKLLIIILVNTLCTSFFEKFGMIGPIGAWCRAKFPKEKHVRL